MSSKPVAFISPTERDLKQHREQAARAALASGFFPEMMEYFPASGQPALSACLEKAARAELVIAIAAHRYGGFRMFPKTPTPKASPGSNANMPGMSPK